MIKTESSYFFKTIMGLNKDITCIHKVTKIFKTINYGL